MFPKPNVSFNRFSRRSSFYGVLLVLAMTSSACGSSDLKFDRLEDTKRIPLALKLESMEGIRDGDSVRAEVDFRGNQDTAHMSLLLHLGPPARFVSGTYRVRIAGALQEGAVECPSLKYLGGQNGLPSVGGTFLLSDGQGRAAYRVELPATPIQRRLVP